MSSSSPSSHHGSSSPEFPSYTAPVPHTLPEYSHPNQDLFSPIMPSKYAPRTSWPPFTASRGPLPLQAAAPSTPAWPAPPQHQLPAVDEQPTLAFTRPSRHSYPASLSYGYPSSTPSLAEDHHGYPSVYLQWQHQQAPSQPHGYPPHMPPPYHGYYPPPMQQTPTSPPKSKSNQGPHPVGPILEPGEELAARPPFTFAALIGQALLEAPPPHQLYVSEIADSIKRRYAYYRQHPNKIYNGVRHQTSMCKAFIKLPRPFGDQSGGARKWTIRPGCESWFAGGGYHPPSETETISTAAKSKTTGGKTKSSASIAATRPGIKMPVLRLNVGVSRNSELSPPPEQVHHHSKESHPCAPNGAPISSAHAQLSPVTSEGTYTPIQSYYSHPSIPTDHHPQGPQSIPPFPSEYMMQAPPLVSPYGSYPYPYPGHHYAPYPYMVEDAMGPQLQHSQWSYPQPPAIPSMRHLADKPEPAKAPIDFSVGTGTPSPRSSGRASPSIRLDAKA